MNCICVLMSNQKSNLFFSLLSVCVTYLHWSQRRILFYFLFHILPLSACRPAFASSLIQ
eukprot:GSChrysophyteH1.ASY1.ANO1.1669.1 assembled CDS